MGARFNKKGVVMFEAIKRNMALFAMLSLVFISLLSNIDGISNCCHSDICDAEVCCIVNPINPVVSHPIEIVQMDQQTEPIYRNLLMNVTICIAVAGFSCVCSMSHSDEYYDSRILNEVFQNLLSYIKYQNEAYC